MTTTNAQTIASPADLAALTAEQKQERLGALYDALDAVDAQDAEISDLIPFLAALGISAKAEDDGEGRLPNTLRLVLGAGWTFKVRVALGGKVESNLIYRIEGYADLVEVVCMVTDMLGRFAALHAAGTASS